MDGMPNRQFYERIFKPRNNMRRNAAHFQGGLKMRQTFLQIIENYIGLPIDKIQNLTIDEQRENTEKKTGKTMSFISLFPFIGRGNVLRDRTTSRQKIEKDFERAIHDC